MRNRLAELILDAFDDSAARETLEALADFCCGGNGRIEGDAAGRLLALGWFERVGPEEVRLRGTHRDHEAALCRRAAAAVGVFRSRAAVPDATTLPGLLGRAALLAGVGLFFEVHELLEPAWMRADGLRRVALQGLIQLAVAQHHAANGNREGAISLLGEGLAKLATSRAALPLDTTAWEAALGQMLVALEVGAPPPVPPRWPTPTETAWRSS